MENTQQKRTCTNCGSPNAKLIPAGISRKTNKPYNSFISCPDCHKTQSLGNDKPKPQVASNAKFDAINAKLDEILEISHKIYRHLNIPIPSSKGLSNATSAEDEELNFPF